MTYALHRVMPLVVIALGCAMAKAQVPNQMRAEWLSQPCPLGLPAPTEGARHAGVGALLLAAVAPKLIEGGVDMAAKALTAAGQAKEDALDARTNSFYYVSHHEGKNHINARCLVVVEAQTFDADSPPDSHLSWARTSTTLKRFSAPRMVFMAAVRPLPEGKFITLEPAYLELNGTRKSGFFSARGKLDYNFAIAMETPGSTKPFASSNFTFEGLTSSGVYTSTHPVLQSAKSLPMPMPEVSAPGQAIQSQLAEIWAPRDRAAAILDRYIRRNDPRPAVQPSLYMPRSNTFEARQAYCQALSAANEKRPRSAFLSDPICDFAVAEARATLANALSDMELSQPLVSWAYEICYPDVNARNIRIESPPVEGHSCQVPEQATKLHGLTYTYFTTHVVSSEVRPGSKFAKFLGEALSASKADVSRAFASKIPALTDAQKIAEEEGDRSARRAVLEADLAVEAAEATLAATPDSPVATKTQAKLALLKAKFTANDAYRKSGRVPPYPEAD
jgi:hypothetical protein